MEVIVSIINQLDWFLIIAIISAGEIVKKVWITTKVKTIFKVLIPSLIIVALWVWLFGYHRYNIIFTSYLFSFWIYDTVVKFVLQIFNN